MGLLFASALLGMGWPVSSPSTPNLEGKVTRIVDGQTLIVIPD